jgi:cyanate permease
MKPATASSFKVSYGVFAFFLLAANLRPALTSVGPLLETNRSSLGLSDAAAAFHTVSEPPVVKHFIASTSMPTKRDRSRNSRIP